MVKNKILTGIALLLVCSLTACQSADSRQEAPSEKDSVVATQSPQDDLAEDVAPQQEDPVEGALPQQEDPADILDESIPETTVPDGLVLVYTGIQSEITECNAEYPQYPELREYLDETQFSVMSIAHMTNTELFMRSELREDWEERDWDLVRPLHNVSAYDCGYAKIDYNNDGAVEIIYRAINNNRKISATVYIPNNAAGQIESEYNLVGIFPAEDMEEGTLQQIWFKKIGEDVVTFRLLRKDHSEEFVIYSDIVTVRDTKLVCTRLETRDLTVTTAQAENSDQDIFNERTLNLTKGEGEVFEALRREQVIAYQEERQIDAALETTGLPEGFVQILKEVLAGTQYVYGSWNMEGLSAYEDQTCQVTLEQMQTYLGEAFPDYYDEVSVRCAYLVDLDQDGKEELILLNDLGGSGGYADVDLWGKQEDGTAEKLYSIMEGRGYAALLEFNGNHYFVVRRGNYNTGETDGFLVITAGTNGTLQYYLIGMENRKNKKSWIETYRDEGMDETLEQWLADDIERRKREIEEKTVSDGNYQLMDGSAETLYQESGITFPLEAFSVDQYGKQSCRIVDFDNDGRMECVRKTIWYPSSRSSSLGLIWYFYKEYDSYVHETRVEFPCFSPYYDSDNYGTNVDPEESFEKTMVQLWFEEFDQKVYTFCMYRVGASSDYLLEVSLIEGEKLHPLLQYLLIAEKEYTFRQVDINSLWVFN